MQSFRKITLITFCATGLALANNNIASALLIGDEITADATWVNAPGGQPIELLSGATAIVDSLNPEFQLQIPGFGGSLFQIDFQSNDTFRIDIDFQDLALYPTDFDITLSDLDWVDAPGFLTGVTLTNTNAPSPGFLDVISFTSDSINISSATDNFQFGPAFFAEYSYTAEHDETQTTPEPTSILGLLGLGILGVIEVYKSKR